MRRKTAIAENDFALGLILILSACVAACAKMAPAANDGGLQRAAVAQAPGESRLLTETASMEVAVDSVPQAADRAIEIVKELGGYVSQSETGKERAAELHLRIPSARLADALQSFAGLGEEKSRQVSANDVTEQFHDLDAQLKNKQALRDRLRSLLSRATTVKDVLAVEDELTRLQTDLDELEGKLKRMREDIAMAAVDLTLSAKLPTPTRRILGPLGYLWVGTKWFITKLFVIRSGSAD